jgi:8-oxo-dGTP pyrophosphatase MutT (NUDIX family)
VNGPPLRRSCRALLIDGFGRILLLQALRRELCEATGLRLTAADAAQLVWVQTAALPEMREHGYAGVTNCYFLIRVDAFEPASGDAANAPGHPEPEGVLDQRWWSLTDITVAHRRGAVFPPRALPTLLRSILTNDPPATPIAIGL